MSDNRRSCPRHVYKWFVDDVPMHKEISAGGQDEGIENIGNHEDGIQHDGEAAEDGFVDTKNLGWQRDAADFSKARFFGVPHDERQSNGSSSPPDINERAKEAILVDRRQGRVRAGGRSISNEKSEKNG